MTRRRILLLGSDNFVGAKVQAALDVGDWAQAVPYTGPPGGLSERHLAGIESVFNGTMGSPVAILAAAKSLYGTLERSGMSLRVVHLSSMTVYGSRLGEVVESTPLRCDLGAYANAQVSAESLAGQHPRSVILRPGCEYGPGCPQWSERVARLLRSHRLGDLGAEGDGICNLLYIDDLVAAIVTSLHASGLEGSCFNLAMRSPPTWNEYFTAFARALGAVPVARISAQRLAIEARMLAPPLKILEILQRRVPGLRDLVPSAITPSLLNLCGQNITLDCRKAEQVLALNWTPLQEGLRRAAAASTAGYSVGNISMRRKSIG